MLSPIQKTWFLHILNSGEYQVLLCEQISAVVLRYLDDKNPFFSVFEILSIQPVSVAARTGLFGLVKNPEDLFSCVEAQTNLVALLTRIFEHYSFLWLTLSFIQCYFRIPSVRCPFQSNACSLNLEKQNDKTVTKQLMHFELWESL